MNNPGNWILGEPTDLVRNVGMGILLEHANQLPGSPNGSNPPPSPLGLHRIRQLRSRIASTAQNIDMTFSSDPRRRPRQIQHLHRKRQALPARGRVRPPRRPALPPHLPQPHRRRPSFAHAPSPMGTGRLQRQAHFRRHQGRHRRPPLRAAAAVEFTANQPRPHPLSTATSRPTWTTASRPSSGYG